MNTYYLLKSLYPLETYCNCAKKDCDGYTH